MFKDTVTKFPRTWAKRSFLSLKNGLTSKFLKTVKFTKSVFKKETWSKLYQTFKMATITKTDDLFSSLTGKKKPINTPDKTPGTPNKNSGKTHPDNKAPNTKTPGDKTPDVDESELSKVSKYEDDVDDATKKKMRDKADNEVEKGPNHNSKTKALVMARIITETNDQIDTPIPLLKTELAPLKAMKGVNDFTAEGGTDGVFEIYMIGSKYKVDGNYSIAKKSKWVTPKQDMEGPGLKDHFNKHGEELGFTSRKMYDESARLTIEKGRKFRYKDRSSGEPRIGYWDKETGLFTATSQTRKTPVILTHFKESWENLRNLPGFSASK